MHKPKLGPIGRGFVTEVKTASGTRYVARWNAYTLAPDGSRKRVTCGPHELGSKISHGPGLKSLAEAKREWEKVYWTVFLKHHPELLRTDAIANPAGKLRASGQTKVKDFISAVWEPERATGLEDNSRINWEYYRDSFLLPFFGEMMLAELNDKGQVKAFMQDVADREFSNWTAKKAFSYVKGILDMSRDMGLTIGNESRLIPKTQRIPKGVKTAHSQPYTSGEDFVNILSKIDRPRDQIILKILFLCAVRRSELFVFKWSDFDGSVLSVRRSFDSRTHKINEWNPDRKAHGKVAVPPSLASDLEGWRKYGDTTGAADSFIFPTRNGTSIVPTNWAEDVLKPAGEKAGIPDVSYHWFRRGHATIQHVGKATDKSIQNQLRHSKAETTRNIYMQHVDSETRMAVASLEAAVMGLMNNKE